MLSREHKALASSAAIHLAIFVVVAFSAALNTRQDKSVRLGSEELDVELLAPRLAPPLRSSGHEGRAGEQAGTAREETAAPRRRGSAAPVSAALAPRRARSFSPRSPVREEPRAADTERRASPSPEPRAQAPAPSDSVPPKSPARRDEPRRTPGLAQDRQGEAPLAHLPQELPQTAPLAVLTAMSAELSQRRERHEQALTRQRARRLAAERELARLNAIHEKTGRLASLGGGAGREPVRGEISGVASRQAAGGGARVKPRYGMRFYLSGRRVESGKVVRPPEPIHIPAIKCTIANPAVTPATVRLLVDMKGKVQVAYLKHSSSSARFDRCALRHSKAITFKPGEDVKGAPLDVWIHLRVEPSLITARR